MKIGMEPDPVEELERELDNAIAAAARAQFDGQGDVGEALARVRRLSRKRLDWNGGMAAAGF